MTGWQEFLDDAFPNGLVMQLVRGEEDELFFHVPRFWVIKDEPSPLVSYLALEAPQQPEPHRLVSWRVQQKEPLLVNTAREDGQALRLSANLTQEEIDLMRPWKDRNPGS